MDLFVYTQRIRVNVANWAALERRVGDRLSRKAGFALATINLDHIVKLRNSAAFRDAYARHDLIYADGNPIAWIAELAGKPVELIPGSDAILPLARSAARQCVSIALLASTPPALSAAAAYFRKECPSCRSRSASRRPSASIPVLHRIVFQPAVKGHRTAIAFRLSAQRGHHWTVPDDVERHATLLQQRSGGVEQHVRALVGHKAPYETGAQLSARRSCDPRKPFRIDAVLGEVDHLVGMAQRSIAPGKQLVEAAQIAQPFPFAPKASESMPVKSVPSTRPARSKASRLRTWVTICTSATSRRARARDQPTSGTLTHSGVAASAIPRGSARAVRDRVTGARPAARPFHAREAPGAEAADRIRQGSRPSRRSR